ncbi:MAG: hypothetical protein U0Z75_01740 [Deinococcaceae bacterium]
MSFLLIPWLVYLSVHSQPWSGFFVVWTSIVCVVVSLFVSVLLLSDSVSWGSSGGYTILRLSPIHRLKTIFCEAIFPSLISSMMLVSILLLFKFLQITRNAINPELSIAGLIFFLLIPLPFVLFLRGIFILGIKKQMMLPIGFSFLSLFAFGVYQFVDYTNYHYAIGLILWFFLCIVAALKNLMIHKWTKYAI